MITLRFSKQAGKSRYAKSRYNHRMCTRWAHHYSTKSWLQIDLMIHSLSFPKFGYQYLSETQVSASRSNIFISVNVGNCSPPPCLPICGNVRFHPLHVAASASRAHDPNIWEAIWEATRDDMRRYAGGYMRGYTVRYTWGYTTDRSSVMSIERNFGMHMEHSSGMDMERGSVLDMKLSQFQLGYGARFRQRYGA